MKSCLMYRFLETLTFHVRLSQIMRYLCGVAYVLENLNVDGRQKPIQGAKSTMPWSRKSKSQNDGRKWPKKNFMLIIRSTTEYTAVVNQNSL